MDGNTFDVGLMKLMIIAGVVFFVGTCIAMIMLEDIVWVILGIFLGGGAISLGVGGLMANNDALHAVSETEDKK